MSDRIYGDCDHREFDDVAMPFGNSHYGIQKGKTKLKDVPMRFYENFINDKSMLDDKFVGSRLWHYTRGSVSSRRRRQLEEMKQSILVLRGEQ